MRSNLRIPLADVELDAWFYRPADVEGPTPTIIMSFGFSGLKAMGLDGFAEVFAAAGLASLVYDHRGFGASGGTPVRDIDPLQQVADMRDVISFARGLDGVDPERIGLWGTSYAGGHTIMVSAIDRRVRCAVAQVPFISGKASVEGLIPSYLRPRWLEALVAEREARFRGAGPTYVPVAVDPEQQEKGAPYHLGLVDAREPGFAWLTKAGQAAGYENSVTLSSYDHFWAYEPGSFIERVSPTPLLMILGDDDQVCLTATQLAAFNRAHEPKKLKLLHSGHYDVYWRKFDDAAEAACAWFQEHLITHQSPPAQGAAFKAA
jgi:uncharacterized protein